MARNGQCPCADACAQTCSTGREDFLRARREALENTAMCRYANPIPACAADGCCCGCCGCGCRCGCGCGCDCRQDWDDAAILAALEQQSNLLAELLAAVTGLTAACLCRKSGE